MRSLDKCRTVQLTTWVNPSVKEAYEHIAKDEGVSLSRVGAATLEESLARRIHVQHAGILQPIIEHAIAKEMRAYSSRLALLLVRSLFASEQTRAIAYNLLRKPPSLTLTDAMVDKIMDGSKNTAKRNIAQVSPELAPIIREIEAWLTQAA